MVSVPLPVQKGHRHGSHCPEDSLLVLERERRSPAGRDSLCPCCCPSPPRTKAPGLCCFPPGSPQTQGGRLPAWGASSPRLLPLHPARTPPRTDGPADVDMPAAAPGMESSTSHLFLLAVQQIRHNVAEDRVNVSAQPRFPTAREGALLPAAEVCGDPFRPLLHNCTRTKEKGARDSLQQGGDLCAVPLCPAHRNVPGSPCSFYTLTALWDRQGLTSPGADAHHVPSETARSHQRPPLPRQPRPRSCSPLP